MAHAIVDLIGPNVMGFGIAFIGLFAGAMNIAEWREKVWCASCVAHP